MSSARPQQFCRCMWVSLWVGLCASAFITGSAAVGIKRRLTDAQASEASSKAKAAPSEPSSSSTSRRGGLHQRLARESSEISIEGSPDEKPLWKGLIRRWAEGKISAGEVQQYASEAIGQGAQGMQPMAAIGNFGSNPQNCHRALKNLLGLPSGAPDLHWARIPTARGGSTWHPFLMPHEFFMQYFIGQREHWGQTITGPMNAALQFWQSMEKSNYMRLHPDLAKSTWQRTVPLGLHGDGAAFSHHDSLYVFLGIL